MWPLLWLRDPTFWRDVLSRTLSALCAAGIGFLFARAAGLFGTVSWWDIAKAAAPFALTLALIALVAFLLRKSELSPMEQERLICTLHPAAGGAYWSAEFTQHMLDAEAEYNQRTGRTGDMRSRRQPGPEPRLASE